MDELGIARESMGVNVRNLSPARKTIIAVLGNYLCYFGVQSGNVEVWVRGSSPFAKSEFQDEFV